MRLTSQERNTLVAALTFYLEAGQGEPAQRSDDIHSLACGEVPYLDEDISMDDEGIESLIGKLTR